MRTRWFFDGRLEAAAFQDPQDALAAISELKSTGFDGIDSL